MLVALSIRNFVLIDRLDLDLSDGFTSLTGETGAGKSILLDALALVIGAQADRSQVRAGADRAAVSAAFAVSANHAIWRELSELGIEADAGEHLILKRIVPSAGPSRAFMNDQPVGTAALADIGCQLLEIHGQHAAAALMRPSEHRIMLDRFSGATDLVAVCGAAWDARMAAERAFQVFSDAHVESHANLETLKQEHKRLAELAPETGETDRLAAERSRLMQAGRLNEHLSEAEAALEDGTLANTLAGIARHLDQICRLPGYDDPADPAGADASAIRDGFERALIELQEAERGLSILSAGASADPNALDLAEERLFALRAAARKHGVEPDQLPDVVAELTRQLSELEDNEGALERAEQAAKAARAEWHTAAEALSKARRVAAKRLEARIVRELRPLKLQKAAFRVSFKPVAEGRSGALGAETVAFEWEANDSGRFGSVSKVASGGELARLCLALNCALAREIAAETLIFDEADQGVGGAVAAAIGDRLSRLGQGRQVLAITHSPQVAAAADHQWQVSKTAPRKGLGRTLVTGLDETSRLEEIARMLAGATVTSEARAAAGRLLEDGCQLKKRPPT